MNQEQVIGRLLLLLLKWIPFRVRTADPKTSAHDTALISPCDILFQLSILDVFVTLAPLALVSVNEFKANILFASVGWLVSGNYKVQIFDYQINDYLPTTSGLGMHVDARDPDDKTIISRVRIMRRLCNTTNVGHLLIKI